MRYYDEYFDPKLHTVVTTIKPIEAYQTTDGQIFIGIGAKQSAEEHQKSINDTNTPQE